MPKIEYKEGKDFAELPVREPVLVKINESNFETEDNPFANEDNDEPRTRDVVKVVFEALDEEYAGTRVWQTYTASIHEKSKLRPLIQAASDHELTLEELKEFDTDDLAGRRLYIIGEYNEKKDPEHKFLRPTGYVRLKSPKSSSKPKPETAEAKPATKPRPSADETIEEHKRSNPIPSQKPEPNEPRDVDPDEIPF